MAIMIMEKKRKRNESVVVCVRWERNRGEGVLGERDDGGG